MAKKAKVPERKASAAKPAQAKRQRKKPARAADPQFILLEEHFEFELLESSKLTFPITDKTKKLTAYQEKLQCIARNKRIHELAIGGATVRQISAKMIATGWPNCSRSNVNKILQKNLDISTRDAQLTAEQRRQLELDKVDQAEVMHFGPFLKETTADGAEKRSRVMERIWKRRDALEGRVQKIALTDKDGETLAPVIRVILPTIMDDPESEDE